MFSHSNNVSSWPVLFCQSEFLNFLGFRLPFSYRSSGFRENHVSSLLFLFCFACSRSIAVLAVLFCLCAERKAAFAVLFCCTSSAALAVLFVLPIKFASFLSAGQNKRVGCFLFCFVFVDFQLPHWLFWFSTYFIVSRLPRWLFCLFSFCNFRLACWLSWFVFNFSFRTPCWLFRLFCFVLFYLACRVSYSVCFVLSVHFPVQ